MLKKTCSILCVLIGLAVILFGYNMDTHNVSHSNSLGYYTYSPDSYYANSATFGGDFYTYIYKASDTIVDELSDINYAMGKVVSAEKNIQDAISDNTEAVDDLINSINKNFRLFVMALGVGILAFGINNVGIAFTEAPKPKAKQSASVIGSGNNQQVAAVQSSVQADANTNTEEDYDENEW